MILPSVRQITILISLIFLSEIFLLADMQEFSYIQSIYHPPSQERRHTAPEIRKHTFSIDYFWRLFFLVLIC